MRKVCVTGARDWVGYEAIAEVLDAELGEHGRIMVIHGAAPGADLIADSWAISNSQAVKSYPAAWGLHGKAAGPIRNRQMLDETKPDIVYAFPGPRSKGTWDCVKAAEERGIRVRIWNSGKSSLEPLNQYR